MKLENRKYLNLENSLENQMWSQLGARRVDHLTSQLWNQLYGQLRDPLGVRVRTQLWAQLKTWLTEELP